MSDIYSFLDDTPPSAGAGSDIDSFLGPEEKKSSTARRVLGDGGISLLKGAIAVPEAAVGLADMVTGGAAGKAAERLGFRPKEAKQILDSYLTPEQQQANKAVQQADGFGDTLGAVLDNPSTIPHAVAESLPLMGAGGGIGRGIAALAPKAGSLAAGAIGEGAVMAGSAAENIRQQTGDGLLTGKQTAAALGTGIAGAALGAAGAKAGKALGIGDMDTAMAGGPLGTSTRAMPARIAGGALAEGALEEMPQSATEQALQNYALDRELGDGVGNAAAMGLVTGGAMGAGFGAMSGRRQPDESAQPEPDLAAAPGEPPPLVVRRGADGHDLVQPTPTAENPAPAPVPRPDPNNGPLSRAASILPTPADWNTPTPVLDPNFIMRDVQSKVGTIDQGLSGRDTEQTVETGMAAEQQGDQPATQLDANAGQQPVFEGEARIREAIADVERRARLGGMTPMLAAERSRLGGELLKLHETRTRKAIPDQRDDGFIVDREGAARPGKINTPPVGDLYSQGGPGMDRQTPRGEPAPLTGQLIRGSQRRDQYPQETNVVDGEVVGRGIGTPSDNRPRLEQDRTGRDRYIPDLREDGILVDAEGNAVPGRLPSTGPQAPMPGGSGMDRPASRRARPPVDALFAEIRQRQDSRREVTPDAISQATGASYLAAGRAIRAVQLEQRALSTAFKSAPAASKAMRELHAPEAFESVKVGAREWRVRRKASENPAVQPAAGVDSEAAPVPAPAKTSASADISGQDIDGEWTAFAPESGTLAIPRAEMPQIKAEHRGAMVNFLNARGVVHEEQTIPAASLKPTQAEFSREKVAKAKDFGGGNRSILISGDGHVLDGHHQWVAAREKGEDVKVIRLAAPIRDLVKLAHEFPSSTTDTSSSSDLRSERPAPALRGQRRTVDRDRDSVVQAAIRLGGITTQWKQDTTGDTKGNKHIPGVGALWSDKTGTSIDDMASLLDQLGYVPASEMGRDGGVSWLQEALRNELAGLRTHYAPGSAMAEQEALREEAKRAARMAEAGQIDDADEAPDELDKIIASWNEQLGTDEERLARAQAHSASLDAYFGDDNATNEQAGSQAQADRVTQAPASGTDAGGRAAGSGQRQARSSEEEGFQLEAETEEGRQAREAREAAALKREDEQRRRKEQRAQADAERDSFTLTGSDRPSDVGAARGQNDLFGAQMAPQPSTGQHASVAEQLASMDLDDLSALIDDVANETAAPQTSKPKAQRSTKAKTPAGKPRLRKTASKAERTDIKDPDAVTRTAGEIAKSLGVNMSSAGMNALEGLTKLFGGPGRLNSGLSFDEETYAQAKPHFAAAMADIQAAGKDLRDFIRALVSQFGDGVKPYILRYAQDLKQEQDSGSTNQDLESDRPADAEQGAGRDLRTEEPGAGGRGTESLGTKPGRQGAVAAGGIRGDSAAVAGERGNQPVDGQEPGVAGGDAGGTDGGRGRPSSTGGLYAGRIGDGAVDSAVAAAVTEPAPAHVEASDKPGTLAEIKEQIPFLTEGQAEDVVFAEKRLMKPDGYGVLYTNGTGTGKTFTGLGIMSRAFSRGKENILVVAPKQTIVDAWVKAAKTFFGLDIKTLESTQDNGGSGIVATTYANLGANNSLAQRDWDMVVADEAHYLSSAEDGAGTRALTNMRALTKRRGYARMLVDMQNAEDAQRAESIMRQMRESKEARDNQKLEREAAAIFRRLEALADEKQAEWEAMAPTDKPRAVFLSATPFAYEKNVQWAQQFLFDWGDDDGGSLAYNSGSPFDRFMMQHFGYRMRYNKLTEPDAKVDRGLMQRAFNSWLKREGALSARALDSDFDYDRLFVTVDSPIGRRVDDALKWLSNMSSGRDMAGNDIGLNDEQRMAFRNVGDKISKENFNYHSRMYFLEAIKAREALPHIRAQLAAGRKVLVMHDFKKGGAMNPFVQRFADQLEQDAYERFADEFRDLIQAFDFLPSPISQLSKAFPDALVYNGSFSAKQRLAMQNAFNDDAEDAPRLMIAQGDAMREGVSIHDTTGRFQRVLVHLGMPVKPTAAIQQEGRIYRTGQASDALFRYFTIGTGWERSAFASKIAGRAGAAENLAMGEQARGLKQSFIDAYENADLYEPGFKGEGTGGKAEDRAAAEALTPWDMAKSFYFGTKRQGKGRSSRGREGDDYFATPEPVGLKMVEFADIRGGESVLEPSAGHGAIARWFPDNAKVRVIEDSADLASRVALHVDGDVVHGRFEDHNIVNKYDAIVMNPPYGLGGAVAIPHLAKAAEHLREGGRVVALIPTGPAADRKFDNWFYGQDRNGKALHPDLHLVGDVKMPSVTFERAGTGVATRLVVIEKVSKEQAGQVMPTRNFDLSDINDIGTLFDRLEHMEIRARVKPVEAEEAEQTEPTKSVEPKKSFAEQEAEKSGKYVTDAPIVEHVTKGGEGKTLRGIIVRDMTLADVKAKYYKYAFPKDGGVFLREEFVQRPVMGLSLDEEAKLSRAGLSPSSVVIGTVPENPISLAEAEAAVQEFFADYNGNIPLTPRIRKTQHELYGPNGSIERIGIVKGAYHSGRGIFTLASDHLSSVGDARETLRHEILGHFGLDTFKPADKQAFLEKILASKEEPSLKPSWQKIARLYSDMPEVVQAEEVFAFIAEKERSTALKIVDMLRAALTRLLRNVGLKKRGILTRSELLREVEVISKGIRNGNRTLHGGEETEARNRRSDDAEEILPAAEVARAIAASPELAGVKVVQSFDDLPIVARFQALRDGVRPDQLRGVYSGGSTYVVANNHGSVADAVYTAVHEEVGHRGIRGMLGAEIEPVMQRLYASQATTVKGRQRIKQIRQAYARVLKRRSIPEQRLIIAEEMVAHLLEDGDQPTALQRVLSKMRELLRRMFPQVPWTYTDILALGEQSRAWLRRQQDGAGSSDRYSLSAMKSVEANIRRGRDALARAVADKTSVHRAMFRNGLGWIDFVWGSTGRVKPSGKTVGAMGLSHIFEARQRKDGLSLDGTARLLDEIVETIARGEEIKREEIKGSQTAKIRHGDTEAILTKKDGSNAWLVTGWKMRPDAGMAGSGAHTPTHASPTPAQGSMGADLSTPGTQRDTSTSGSPRGTGSTGKNDAESADVNTDTRYSLADEQESREALRKLGLAGQDASSLLEQIRNLTLAGLKAKIGEWSTRSEEGLFDGLNGIKRAEEAVGITSADQQGYVSARMASGIADVMHGVLHYAAPEWRDGVVAGKAGTRGVLEILGDLGPDNLTPWLAWLGGKRGQLLKAQDRENNLTDADITELLAMGRGKEALFERVYRDYAKTNEAVLDLAEQAGLIDADARAKWATDYYVPFYRQQEGDEGLFSAPRTKRGLSHQTAAIRALKGGKLPTNDLLANMLAGWTKRIDAAMKNRALLEVVDNLKGSDYLADESPRYQQVLISRSQIATQIRKDRKALRLAAQMLGMKEGANTLQVLNELMKPQNEGFEKLWTRVAPTDPDIIRVQRAGQNEYYRVNDVSLLRGLRFMEGSAFNDPITRVGRAFKRILTTGVTASPDFILRNFIRDAAHAWMINRDGFALGKDSIKGMRDALREDQAYRDLMFAGGSFQGGYVHGTDPEASAQIIRRALEKKGFTRQQREAYLGSLVDTPAKAAAMLKEGWQKYRELGDKVENANRLSTYKAALAAGKSKRQAAFEAKDLMDYSLRGNFAAAQWFTDVVPFLNARLQGLYKLGRAVKGDKTLIAKEVAMKGAYIALFSLLLAGLNDDDERYRELQDWDKDANWHIFLGEEHFRIPKPFELGLLFGTVPERLLHALTGSQDGDDLAKAVAHGVFQTLDFSPVPQFYQPIREVQANRSFYFDRPIEDMSDEGKLPAARYDERTSALSRGLGQLTGPTLGISPKQLDHLVMGYTGTLGGYVLGVSNLIASAFSDAERPALAAGDLPLVKVLYQGDAVRPTQYQTEFYDMLQETDQLYRTIRGYREEGKPEQADQLYEENRAKLQRRPALGLARKQLGNVRAKMDKVYRDTEMDGAAKRQRLNDLQLQANQIAERVTRLAGGDF